MVTLYQPFQVFSGESMLKYLRVFNFLWRGKRMEYCLVGMWREQTAHSKVLKALPGMYMCMYMHVVLSGCVFLRIVTCTASESLVGVSNGPLHIPAPVLHHF